MGESILQEAQKIIHGDRNKTYGHPRDQFALAAALWSEYLGVEITADDHAAMMILLKLSRVKTGGYHRDAAVDIAGYAGTMERLREPETWKVDGGAAGDVTYTLGVDERVPRTWESMVDVPVDVQVKDQDGDIWWRGPEGWWYFHPPEGPAHRAEDALEAYDDSGPFTEITVQEGQV